MIKMTPAAELELGDMLSTDGSVVEALVVEADAVTVVATIPGRVTKTGVFAPDRLLPVWKEEA